MPTPRLNEKRWSIDLSIRGALQRPRSLQRQGHAFDPQSEREPFMSIRLTTPPVRGTSVLSLSIR